MAGAAKRDPTSAGDLAAGTRLLTAAEVARRIRTTERYVWSLGRRGVLARVVLPGGRLVRFLEADVDALILERRTAEPARPRRERCEKEKTRPATAQLSLRF